ncbi:hypothetical protein FGE12_17620 [Aggregicoccus sp. 17bor-14]|uniref:hypothetical protein n=1 Tax=Myxococcaceae TaxID=31 RepID=UPI00129C5EA1|nr:MULTISPECIES: hypothetical protein [Myxococcaceae]MBF5044221.1 hypothetical protein [Simulacricoccus sp. 17bor-14]MRI89971.1 hypothetical protein [Aggregicoccus sp. 17bor-14]
MRALLLSLLLLAAGTAHADWRALAVAGTPTDVEVWRPGVFSVSTTSQAVLVVNGAVTQTVAGESLGTLLTPDGCLLSLQRNGSFVSASTCPHPADNPFGTSGLNIVSYARTAGGAAFTYGELGSDQRFAYTPSAADAGLWTPLLNDGARKATRVADAARVAGVDHALFGLLGGTGTELFWYAGATSPRVVSLDAGVALLEAELFPLEGAAPGVLLGAQGGLYRGVLGAGAFEPVPLPPGVTDVTGVVLTPDAGTALGDGFGLAAARLADGGHAVLNAVPVTRGADVGRSWRLNSSFPGPTVPAGMATADLERVRCVDASFCVLTVRSSTGNNLLVYSNAAAPSFGAPAPLTLDEGEQRVLDLPAVDPDGDALHLEAALADGGTAALGLDVAEVDGGLQLTVRAGAVCAAASGSVELRAADGLAAHDVLTRLGVSVRDTQPDPRVVLTPVDATGLQVRCGEGASGRLVQPLPTGLCADVAVGWTQLSGPQLESPQLSGAQVEVRTVEKGLDALLGETLVLQVSADAGSGNAASQVQSLTLSAEPFVALRHRTERPLTVEGETVGVFVDLDNPTACALSDVRVEEQLEGLDYVPGSARFEGAPVDAQVQDGRLVVTGLPLAAGARATLGFSVRTRLLGEGRVKGEAFRRSVRISEAAAPSPEPQSCGCGGAPAGASAVSLLALAGLLRRLARVRG